MFARDCLRPRIRSRYGGLNSSPLPVGRWNVDNFRLYILIRRDETLVCTHYTTRIACCHDVRRTHNNNNSRTGILDRIIGRNSISEMFEKENRVSGLQMSAGRTGLPFSEHLFSREIFSCMDTRHRCEYAHYWNRRLNFNVFK